MKTDSRTWEENMEAKRCQKEIKERKKERYINICLGQ
jgi:hypothetical protein